MNEPFSVLSDKQRVFRWLRKLSQSNRNMNEMRLRNEFMYHLLQNLQGGELHPPFKDPPPAGPLPVFSQMLCTVWMPDIVTRALRPPVDCSMCRDVHSIDRVSNITPKEFEEIYAFSGRPVIITDAMKNWTAQSVFSFDFFRDLYIDSMAQEQCQFFPYQTEFRSLWEVFQMSEERSRLTDGTDPWYIGWSNCDDKAGMILRQHYDRPYFLPENSENKNTDWIFMGTPGYGAHMHVDNVNNPSWQAQLVGTKNWTLEPPPECIYECKGHEITVYPGEIFVLDTNSWYHSTRIVSNGISITIGAEYD